MSKPDNAKKKTVVKAAGTKASKASLAKAEKAVAAGESIAEEAKIVEDVKATGVSTESCASSQDDVILSVSHLKQFFRFGTGISKYNKAVHDVSFDIHRGEVLGLVGESGCGKTTTGRSIIKLYDITSGSVYFEGYRIGAGTRWNEKEIKFKRKKAASEISIIKGKKADEISALDSESPSFEDDKEIIALKYDKQIEDVRIQLSELVKLQYKEIALARHDNALCNIDFGKQKIAEVNVKFIVFAKTLFENKDLNAVNFEQLVSILKKYGSKKLSYSTSYKQELPLVKAAEDELLAISDVYFKSKTHDGSDKFAFVEKLCAFVQTVNSKIDSTKFDKVDLDLYTRLDKGYFGLIKALPIDAYDKTYSNGVKLVRDYFIERHVAKHEKITSRMQMIFQDPIASLDPRMTVKEIIAEGLRIRGVKDNAYIQERVEAVLKEVGLLPEHASRYPHEFSGGQRQRIGIARALIMDPDLIIADEPISALDVSIQAQVINLLNDLRHDRHLTILFIAHDLSVVKYFCNRIAVMYFGNLVELATSDELFAHPLHPYTKALLSAIPFPDPHYEKSRKRTTYNPMNDHETSSDQPRLREVGNGHFVRCTENELKKYRLSLLEK